MKATTHAGPRKPLMSNAPAAPALTPDAFIATVVRSGLVTRARIDVVLRGPPPRTAREGENHCLRNELPDDATATGANR